MKNLASVRSPGFFSGAAADSRRNEFDIENSVLVVKETPVNICFVGDSITHYWELGAYFQKYALVINRGIGGDTADVLAKRFDADVLQLKPKLCVLMVGINNTWILDDYAKQKDALQEKEKEILVILKNSYRSILQAAKEANQAMFLCSVLPVSYRAYRNQFVLQINAMLKELCISYKIPYVDYHRHMVKEDGLTLKDGLSWDGVHPHVFGYDCMAQVITPMLEEFFS